MKKYKAEELIKKKLEELSDSPVLESFDKQQSWKRMQFRLEKSPASHSGWWKIAAAVLLLIATGYVALHFRKGQIHSTPDIPATVVVNRPLQNTLTDTRIPGDTMRKAKKNIVVKKITRKVEKAPVPLAGNGHPKIPLPDQPVVMRDTISQKENISGWPQAAHLVAETLQPSLAKQPLRVVHINEIGNAGIPQSPVKRNESSGMLSVRLTSSAQTADPLLANRKIHTELIKINISSKN